MEPVASEPRLFVGQVWFPQPASCSCPALPAADTAQGGARTARAAFLCSSMQLDTQIMSLCSNAAVLKFCIIMRALCDETLT